MKQTINDVIISEIMMVRLSKGCLFFKDDVINLLTKLAHKITDIPEEKPKVDINDLKYYIEENLYQAVQDLRTDDVIDFDSAEFTIDCNCVSISDISFNECNLENKLSSGINKIIDNYIAQ
jgi:hypothetical protein